MKTIKIILIAAVASLSAAAAASQGKTNCKGMNQSASLQQRARTAALDVFPQTRAVVNPQGNGKTTK